MVSIFLLRHAAISAVNTMHSPNLNLWVKAQHMHELEILKNLSAEKVAFYRDQNPKRYACILPLSSTFLS